MRLAKLRTHALSRAAQIVGREVLKLGVLGPSCLEVESGALERWAPGPHAFLCPEWARGEYAWGEGASEGHAGLGQLEGVVGKLKFKLGSRRRGWGAEGIQEDDLLAVSFFRVPPRPPGSELPRRARVHLGNSEN